MVQKQWGSVSKQQMAPSRAPLYFLVSFSFMYDFVSVEGTQGCLGTADVRRAMLDFLCSVVLSPGEVSA